MSDFRETAQCFSRSLRNYTVDLARERFGTGLKCVFIAFIVY